MTMTADELIKTLDLQQHPEGGWYKETYNNRLEGEARGSMTAIYFLLKENETSHWHRVTDADEVWSWIAGSSLMFSSTSDGITVERAKIGMDLASGEVPQIVVKAGDWQTATAKNGYVLVTCVTSPGFIFDSFELAPQSFQPGFMF